MQGLSRKQLRAFKKSVWKNFWNTNIFVTLKFTLSMPFIYFLIVPGIILHLFTELYHRICFRLYGIPLVRARDYFIFDRVKLPYLN